ncbi:multidrug resistance protein [Sulfuriferula plumbiphila]|uniref:Multidrug resistance protein n=1 Tax=Sulfuriferula plumbiphila TaxID=171865 RepID=A0A512LB80_9PROT|nr:HlyD family efflux transporter periplasmic adaptor subunit [Sulfuriferula plumbiphila]BBP04441.1 multidrug resistance protein [Sulfuriferula plumbiphila]GEP31743.1 multidrug resistance protein [Sulfuriferula plumbiphila]
MSEQILSEQPPAQNPDGKPQQRKKWMLVLAAVCVLAALAYGVHWYIHGRHFEYADDAYVAANIVQITPQVAGTVVAIGASETDYVHAGETLVRLDGTNARLALHEAEAQLAQTVREVRTLYTGNGSLAAAVNQYRAELDQARADLVSAQTDLVRRQKLAGTGAVSQEELQHAQTALDNARSRVAVASAQVSAAQEQLRSNQVLTAGTTVRDHPRVQAAAAKVRQTYLDLKRDAILAPVDGYMGKRGVQLGQRVAVGAPLMTLIPLSQVWVDANFKETQLRKMRIGQPVKLTADLYGSSVVYHGHVLGMGAGTGAAFALLPAQNATGNWIKVVQRIPVRVALDPKEVEAHPLRVGLSMEATVDVSNQGGGVLATTPSSRMVAETAVYGDFDHAADRLVSQIISSNLGVKSAHADTH